MERAGHGYPSSIAVMALGDSSVAAGLQYDCELDEPSSFSGRTHALVVGDAPGHSVPGGLRPLYKLSPETKSA